MTLGMKPPDTGTHDDRSQEIEHLVHGCDGIPEIATRYGCLHHRLASPTIRRLDIRWVKHDSHGCAESSWRKVIAELRPHNARVAVSVRSNQRSYPV